jgi:mRNA interferase HigB
MRIITRRRLREFGEQHPDAITPLDAWYRIVDRAEYRTSQDVKDQFGSASFVGGTVTVFNIAGNKYRLVVNIRYEWQTVFIMHVFTHEEYDQWSKERA